MRWHYTNKNAHSRHARYESQNFPGTDFSFRSVKRLLIQTFSTPFREILQCWQEHTKHNTQKGKWWLLILMHNCFTWATLCLVLLVVAMLTSLFTFPKRLHVQQSTCGFISLSKALWQLICYQLKGALRPLDVSLTFSSFNSLKITSGSVDVSHMGCLASSK